MTYQQCCQKYQLDAREETPSFVHRHYRETKVSKQKHIDELADVLTKLENAGYILRENSSEQYKAKRQLIGYKINQNG